MQVDKKSERRLLRQKENVKGVGLKRQILEKTEGNFEKIMGFKETGVMENEENAMRTDFDM